jgi:tetratricopeptide (TPR) repeat protein
VIRDHAVEDFQLELQILNGMGAVYFQQGKTKKAKVTLDRALKMKTKPQNGPTLDFADVWNNLATIYVDERNYAKAADSYMRALELTERRLGASHPNLAMILDNLGLMYIAMRRYEEAERYFHRSLDILERNGLMSNYLAFRTLYGLGRTYVEKNQRNQAEAQLNRAVQIGRTTAQRNTEMVEALELYSNLLRSLSRQSDAERLHSEAARIGKELVWTTRVGSGK